MGTKDVGEFFVGPIVVPGEGIGYVVFGSWKTMTVFLNSI